jgi:hypothetical protein
MSYLTVKLAPSHYVSSDPKYKNPDYTIEIKTGDTFDWNVHDWFKLFEHILAVQGFTEYVIMKGGCELAFAESRSQSDMLRLFAEYELSDFVPKPKEPVADNKESEEL